MKKVTVIMPDGSKYEIEEQYLNDAIKQGAKLYEPVIVNHNGGKYEIDSIHKKSAIDQGATLVAEPAVKKKVSLGLAGATVSEDGGMAGGLNGKAPSGLSEEIKTTHKPQSIEDYNKNFEEITGHKEFDLSEPVKPEGLLSQESYNKQKKIVEEKKYLRNREVEENEFKPLLEKVQYGFDTKKELSELYNKPYGKKVVSSIIDSVVPELNPGILSGNSIDDEKWNEISFAIQAKNRKNYEAAFLGLAKKQSEIVSSIEPGVYEKEILNARGDTKEYVKIDVPSINIDDRSSIGGAINAFNKILGNGEKEYKGVDIAKTILPSLEFRLGELNRVEKIGDDIGTDDFKARIGLAIDQIESDYGRVNDPDYKVSDLTTSETQVKLVQRGLEYYRYAEPSLFKNAKRTITNRSQMAEPDYQRLLDKGQQLENDNIILEAAKDQSFIGKETTFAPKLASLLKSRQSAILGETLKESPFRGRIEYNDSQIDWAVENTDWQAAGVPKPTKTAIDIIKVNEDKWFYDEIPKSGLGHSLLAGVTEPLYAIARTVEDVTSGSYSEDYLRRKQLDRPTSGSQLVMDEKGQLSNVLPSDKGNIFFDITKGTGSFITQMVLTRGLGSPFGAAIKAGTTATTVSNIAGTGISSYLQAYGDAYENTLQKTGDPRRAEIMGNIEGLIAFGTEQFLVEAKVGSKIFKNLTGNVSENIYKIVRSNANPADKIKQISGRLKTFAKSSGDVLIQENFEEVSAVMLNRIAKAIVTPEVPADISLLNEIGQTIHATSLSLAVPSVASGAAAAKNRFTKKVFNSASLNLEYTQSTLKKQVMDGAATQDEYNQAVSLLTTNRNNILLSPKTTIDGRVLNKEQRQEYGFQQTVVQINEEKAKQFADNKDEIQAKIYNDKAKEARAVQSKIVNGEAVDTFTEVAAKPEIKIANDKWKQNIVAIGERTDISEQEKEKLKTAEDDRHAAEMATLISEKPKVESAVIEIGGTIYEGKNHAEAILNAKENGQDISNVNRQDEGKFRLSDGTIIDRATAKQQFGQDRSELLIEQDEAADQANKDYKAETKESLAEQTDATIRTDLGNEKADRAVNDVNAFVESDLFPEDTPKTDKNFAKEKPLQFLKTISDQLQQPSTKIGEKEFTAEDGVVKRYGQEMVDLAKETFQFTKPTQPTEVKRVIRDDNLPDDLQTFLFENLESKGFETPTEYNVSDVNVADLPKISSKQLDKSRGEKYSDENFSDNQKHPIVIINGNMEDGFHRLFAAQKRGDKKIEAIILKTNELKLIKEAAKPDVSSGVKAKASVLVAPFYDSKINTVSEAQEVRNTPEYRQHQQMITDVADKMGVKIASVDNVIGGYKNADGTEIQEVANRVNIETKDLNEAEKFAAVLGSLAHETQEATIASQYVEIGSKGQTGIEVEIKVGDLDEAVNQLKKAGITDYTIDEKNNTVSVIDFGNGKDEAFNQKMTTFVSESKNNIQDGTTYRGIESRFINADRRAEIFRSAKSEAGQQQSGSDLRNLYEQAESADRDRKGQPDNRTNDTGDNAKPEGEPGKGAGDTQQSSVNNSTTTQQFFSETVNGANQPKEAWKPILPLEGGLKKTYEDWNKFRGGFDAHIETNIPAFRDVQIRKIEAISKVLKDGGSVIDLGGSEGGFGKTITESNSNIKTINLDMNPDMEAAHNKNPVAGAEFVKKAFAEDVPLDDGTVVEKYVPTEKADVVHESMMFQFIKPDRQQFVDEIADNYVKPDGVVILEEKVIAENWNANEEKKDKDFKSQYYDSQAVKEKNEKIVVGMKSNQATEASLLDALSSRFKYIHQYWDSGNFKGYIASNNALKAKEMLDAIGDTKTEYTSREDLVSVNNGTPENQPQYIKPETKSDVRSFNEKVDAGVEAILNSKFVKALSADLPKGTKVSGLSIETIVRAGGEVIKTTYKTLKSIEKAIDAGIAHIKKLWEENFGKGADFPEEGLREMLTKQLSAGVSREEKKIVNDAHAQINNGVKESDVVKDLMSKYSVTKDEAQDYVDKANEIIEPPSTAKGAATDFVPIHREAQTEADKLKENYTFGETKNWGESVDAGLDKLAKVATKEGMSLYEAANNQIHKWVANISKTKGAKALFNPNDEQIAQMAYHRAETIRKKNELESQLNSPLLIDKTGALASLEILDNNLENVDYVLNRTGEAAGRAFNIRQLVGKMDAKSGFEYRRMDLLKDNAGEPLSKDQETELAEIYKDEQELNKKREGLDEEKFKQEEFDKRVQQELEKVLRERAAASKEKGGIKKSGVKFANKIRKLKMPRDSSRIDFTLGSWDLLVEGVAKLVEAGATIAEAIKILIDDGKIAFKKPEDKEFAEKYISEANKNSILDEIQDLATEEKSDMLTKSAVGKGLVVDLVNDAIENGKRGKEILSSVHEDLKTVFPDITEQQVRDAYLKEGEYKLERKVDIDNESKKAKLEVRSISKLETDLEDLKAERELRTRHEPSKREPTPEEQKLIDARTDLLNKKDATEAEKKRFTELGKELDRLRDRQDKERKTKPEPKIIDRSDREKELLDDIEKEKSEWNKEKQDLKDMQQERERLINERNKEQKRLNQLTAKRDKLLAGIREPGKKGQPKVESQQIEVIKKEIEQADKNLRDIESKQRGIISNAKKLKDSIAEREQKLSDLKQRGEVWKKRKSKSTKKINSEIDAKNKEIEAELNKQGITLEKGSKEEVAIKKKLAENHNKRTDDILTEIEGRMRMAEFGSEEHEALRQARDMLLNSKVDSDTAQEVFNAIEKSKRFTELAKTELSKYPELSDIVDQINNSQEQLSADEYNTTQEVVLQKYKKTLRTKIKQTQKKIDRGEFEEIKTSRLDKLDAEGVKLEIEQRVIDSRYRKLGEEARLKQRSFFKRLADDFQLVYLAQLIGGIGTEIKVALSGLVKPLLETITRATTGQIALGLFPSLKKAAGGEGFSMRQEAHRFKAGWGAIGAEGMRKMVEKTQRKLDDADRHYDNIRDQAEQIKDYHGEDSKVYKDFIKNELTRAANAQQRAVLDHFSNSMYEWIGSNSWKDAADVFLHSTSRIEDLMGFATREEFGQMKRGDKIRFIIGSMGATHAVLKNFSARSEFAASFVARLENKVNRGVDIRNADEILKTINENFVNYQRGKFQEDSFITDAFKAATAAVGKLGEKNPKYENYAWWTTTGARAKNPIVRTPINITKDAILEYTFGLPRAMFLHGGEAYKALRDAIGDGASMGELYSRTKEALSNIDADKADLILRCYRKGGFAVGMYALAAMGVVGFGGFYSQHEKGKKNKYVGEVYVGGKKLPKVLAKTVLHTPFAMPAILFSNYQRILEKQNKMGVTGMDAHIEAIKSDLEAMKDEIPLLREFSIENQLKRFTLPFAKAVMDVSEWFDVDENGKLIQRKPYDFWDEIEIRTGFRTNVPTKQEYQKMKAEDKRNEKK